MSRKITGTLFNRNGIWYLKARMNGREIIRETTGQTDRGKAEAYQQQRMAVFQIEDQVTRERALLGKIMQSEDALKDARQDFVTLPLNAVWDSFRTDPNKPQCNAEQMRDYERCWFRFRQWLRDQYPCCINIQDVQYRPHVMAYVRHLEGAGLSPNRFNKILNFIGVVFATLEMSTLHDNPFRPVHKKKLMPEGRRELSLAELKAVCEPLTGELKVLFAVGIYTGMRLKDAVHLTWGSVNLRRDLLTVTPYKTRGSSNAMVKVPIHPVLKAILTDKPEAKRSGYVMPGLVADYARHRSLVSRQVQAAFTAAGITTQSAPEQGKNTVCRVGFHSLRHSFITVCEESGIPAAVVASLVGWSSLNMRQVYTHVGVDAARAAIMVLPDRFTKGVSQ